MLIIYGKDGFTSTFSSQLNNLLEANKQERLPIEAFEPAAGQ